MRLHGGFIPRTYARLVMRDSLGAALEAAQAQIVALQAQVQAADQAHDALQAQVDELWRYLVAEAREVHGFVSEGAGPKAAKKVKSPEQPKEQDLSDNAAKKFDDRAAPKAKAKAKAKGKGKGKGKDDTKGAKKDDVVSDLGKKFEPSSLIILSLFLST